MLWTRPMTSYSDLQRVGIPDVDSGCFCLPLLYHWCVRSLVAGPVGSPLMPTNYADCKSSPTHRRPERLNCVVVVAGRTILIDFNQGIRRTVSHLTFRISCKFHLMRFLVLFTIFVLVSVRLAS